MNWPLMGETITLADRLKMAYFSLTAKKFTNGDKVKEFEHEWNNWLGSKHSLYVSSGSTANFLLVAAVKEMYGLEAGDKVLVPACTWMTNVAPIMQLGLTPIFCDVNIQNYSFDLDEVAAIAIKHPDIKMIFVTHLLGFSAENEKLKEIFPKAIIIDDVCESHGCTDRNNVKRGSNSLGATFSFYFGHHMSTIEGGMISTNNYELYDLMRIKRSHGLARESERFDYYTKQYPDISKQFLFLTDGYNFRNHEICAVLGLSQLKRLDRYIQKRNENYKKFVELISTHTSDFYIPLIPQTCSNFCFPLICKTKELADKMRAIFDEVGIEHRPIIGGNLLRQPFLSGYEITTQKDYLNVDYMHDNGIYLGNNHFVGDKELNLLRDILK